MKRFSISMLSVLAIVVAITSAFTTKAKRFETAGYYRPASPQITVKTSGSYLFSSFNTTKLTVTPVEGTSPCGSVDNQVCAVFFTQNATSEPWNSTVIPGGYYP